MWKRVERVQNCALPVDPADPDHRESAILGIASDDPAWKQLIVIDRTLTMPGRTSFITILSDYNKGDTSETSLRTMPIILSMRFTGNPPLLRPNGVSAEPE
jgi:hypothetical protein